MQPVENTWEKLKLKIYKHLHKILFHFHFFFLFNKKIIMYQYEFNHKIIVSFSKRLKKIKHFTPKHFGSVNHNPAYIT